MFRDTWTTLIGEGFDVIDLSPSDLVDADFGLAAGERAAGRLKNHSYILIGTKLGNVVFTQENDPSVNHSICTHVPENLKPFIGDEEIGVEMFTQWSGGPDNKIPNIGHIFDQAFPDVEVVVEEINA